MTDGLGPAAVLRAMGRARERDDFEAALLCIAPESLDQGERVTREDWRRKWESMRDACPDLEIVTEQSVAQGEWIAHRYLLRGTHTGDFFGQPPTGARFETRGLDMVRVRDGQLVEHWAFAGSLRSR
jgi:predicted ester cyclase